MKFFAVGLFVLMALACSAYGNCPQYYKRFGKKCFMTMNYPVPAEEASETCKASEAEAELVTIHSQEEMDDLLMYMDQTGFTDRSWTALRSTDGMVWKWSGTDQVLENEELWGGGPPQGGDAHCAYVCPITKKIWSGDCNREKKFICEAPTGDE